MTAVPDVNLFDADVQDSPYAAYDELRRSAPVFREPASGMYVVTRYDDVREVLRDTERFQSGIRPSTGSPELNARRVRLLDLYREKGWVPGSSLAGYDGQSHADIRALFTKAFRARRIRTLESFVEKTARDLVDAFAGDGHCELVSAFSVPLPLIVIGQQMGVPRDDIWQIKAWTDAWIQRLGMMQTEEEERWSAEMEIEAQHYFQPIFDRLRKTPDDTVLSDLVNARAGHSSLTDHQLHAHMMADTFVGGSETTTNALTAGVWLLTRFPEAYERLAADPEANMGRFIDEVLRLESPVQGLFRVASEDVVLRDVKIPKHATLNVRYAAANRDPEHFPNPEILDLDRSNTASHLAFGIGVHTCIGAPLARRELYWGFRSFLERTSKVRLAADATPPRHQPNFCLRALQELHVEFDVEN
jgi:cytochrome P450